LFNSKSGTLQGERRASVAKEIFIEKEFIESELYRGASDLFTREGVDKKSFENIFTSEVDRLSLEGVGKN
jgi:hypothetical protein